MPRSRFIRCEDGSQIQIRHISRLFVQEDVVRGTATVMASLPGPAHPFVVYRSDNRNAAQVWLDILVDQVEAGGVAV